MDLNESGAIQTGNISTDDFLAIFSATTTTTSPTINTTNTPINTCINGWQSSDDDYDFLKNHNHQNDVLSTAILKKYTPVTLNPPLLTIDGQYTVTSLVDNTLVSFDSILTNTDLNDTFLLWSGNFYNSNTSVPATYGSTAAINLSTTYANFLNSSGNSSSHSSNNQAFNNLTNNITEIHWDGRYPSGYTLSHIVFASIIVTVLMIIIIVGNMLVIIAIATEKSLKNIQNWFIASLAVADFFLGLIIMPFSLANELMGYWIFGSWWCDIHSAMDVLLCTASIMNLCLISLDRYWSITKAVDYLKSRTPARAALMIAAVWIMSALICIPPLLGWKVKLPEGPLPKCQLSEDIGYVLYSALGSFYIPSCIMVFVYIRIYFAAKARARRGIKKHTRKTNNEQVTSFTTSYNKKGTIPMPSSSSKVQKQKHQQQQQQQQQKQLEQQMKQIATIEAPPPNSAASTITTVQIPTVTCDLASDVSTSEAGDMEPQPLLHPNSGGLMSTTTVTMDVQQQHHHQQLIIEQQSTAMANCKEAFKVSTITTSHGDLGLTTVATVTTHTNNLNNNNGGTALVAVKKAATTTTTLTSTGVITLTTTGSELRVSPLARSRALSVGIDTDMVSEFDPSSSDSGVVSRCAVVKPLKFRLCQPIFGRKSNNRRQHEAKKIPTAIIATNATKDISTPNDEVIKAELEPAIPKIQKSRDPEKEKRRIARKKEKRATLILGLIMGSFIACWLPFFFLYILMPVCSACSNHIPDSAFAIAFWLGYMNSALNPAIYTIFNKDFRRAFRRILFK